MSLADIENILHKAMGLNAASIGSSSVLNAVNHRMSACNVFDIDTYKRKLDSDKAELKELIEEVVVPETWFFRDTNPFKMLAKYIREEWLPSDPKGPLRVLSLPCASGEEAYSIAITAIDAGLMPSQVKIDAYDISEKNIERCKEACYRNHSFRGVADATRDRFFTFRNGAYYPDILIKAMVNFGTASLLDNNFIMTRVAYDIVFCRNLLIYFDHATQKQAAEMLYKLLKPAGILFVGHAETGIYTDKCHVSRRYPQAFAMRKNLNQSETQKKPARRRVSTLSKRKIPPLPVKRAVATPPPTSVPKAVTSKPASLPSLDAAEQHADAGRFTQAETLCLQHLEADKQNSRAYYLLALIQIASGDSVKAAEYLKSVIYLNPKHYDALMYLSTLTGEMGDEQGAARYRERAARVKSRINNSQVQR